MTDPIKAFIYYQEHFEEWMDKVESDCRRMSDTEVEDLYLLCEPSKNDAFTTSWMKRIVADWTLFEQGGRANGLRKQAKVTQ